MKQQVWYIGGGDSFLETEEFLQHLQEVPLWHLKNESTGTGWTKTIEEQLGDEYEFIKIPMPNRENARYTEWKIWFKRHLEYMKGTPILVGLSLGAMFLARYLSEERMAVKPKAVFLLAGAYDISDNPVEGGGDFLIKPSAMRSFASLCPLIVMHSEDDFVVPFTHGQTVAEALPEAEFVVFKDKNHFLIEEFPELVQKIKAL